MDTRRTQSSGFRSHGLVRVSVQKGISRARPSHRISTIKKSSAESLSTLQPVQKHLTASLPLHQGKDTNTEIDATVKGNSYFGHHCLPSILQKTQETILSSSLFTSLKGKENMLPGNDSIARAVILGMVGLLATGSGKRNKMEA
ncbi:uncharacterized protein LOC124277821 [Haliotis rubra]|uniref:uncharacterized protein LOC124277821 n=1 Tax=Haliotis rubra TaxID=36100 RepID=UPI001EE5F650|nr:uncharacterized protein LOC124277821 [Haliotis rubra]